MSNLRPTAVDKRSRLPAVGLLSRSELWQPLEEHCLPLLSPVQLFQLRGTSRYVRF